MGWIAASLPFSIRARPRRNRRASLWDPQVAESVDELVVHEVEELGALVDQRHGDAERGSHRRVLDADHAGADNGHRRRHASQAADSVRVDHGAVVEVHA
jgi:hypothetical protein